VVSDIYLTGKRSFPVFAESPAGDSAGSCF